MKTTTEKLIWIDITDLYEWKGHHTGIQRVAYNIADLYNLNGAKFFVYDEIGQNFFEASFDQIPSSQKNTTQSTLEISENSINNTRSLKQFLKSKWDTTPLHVKQRIPVSAKTSVKKAIKILKATKHSIANNSDSKKLASQNEPVVFSKTDSVYILGSPWAKPSLMPALIRKKQVEQFKLVQVIYDTTPILFPHLFGADLFPIFVRYFFEMVSNSNGLVAISESSKKDTLEFCKRLDITPPPVSVMRLGDDYDDTKSVERPQQIKQDEKFILCVGSFEIRKNHALLYYAYKEASSKGIELPKLVIAGRRGWLIHDIGYAIENDPEVNQKITLIHDASDARLTWLYKNCLFTVYPSVYEGWGLPIAESLYYGKMCLSSNTSSMPEIANDLIDYFSPFDSAACLNQIQKYLDNDVRELKEKQIREQFEPTTWRQTYEEFSDFADKI